MEDLAKLIEVIPSPIRGTILLLALVAYLSFPAVKRFLDGRDYWTFRTKQLALLTKISELSKGVDGERLASLDVLRSEVLQIPSPPPPSFKASMPIVSRMAFGSLGALFGMLVITMIHFISGRFGLGTAIGGAILQAIIPSALAYFATGTRKSHVFLFGLGAAWLIHFLIALSYGSSGGT